MGTGPDTDTGTGLGIVAIGRNEGARLGRCLASLAGAGRLVYVDSGSTDDSIALAEGLGAEIVHLDTARGFTAARARNAGLDRLMAAGAPEYVQFVDGDCEVEPGWIDQARAVLAGDPGLACVAGRRAERFADASIFNRLCDMEWNTPIGETRAVGGDALYRTAALTQVGGFDAGFICGEEPELCFRLRRAGWRIRRLDAPMTRHDAAMTRWHQWWRRTRRTGWAWAEGAATYGTTPERYNVRETRSALFWGLAVPAGMLAAGVLAVLWHWAWGLAVPGVLGLGWRQTRRVARSRAQAFDDPPGHARLYGRMVMLGKIPEAMGVLDYWWHRLRGQPGRIIEYKTAGDDP